MAEQLTFKTRMMRSLYGMGLKGFGPTLLTEYKKGGDEWMAFVQVMLEGNDYPSRKLALQQITGRGVIEKSPAKARLIALLLVYLGKGLADEKRMILKFIEGNLGLFPTQDDGFRSKILALKRERDVQLSHAAEALLPKIGLNMDDRDAFRRA